ncbi:MAG: S8 family peptidase [Cyanobacteria bacterium P01_A01_bin.37]
MLSNSSVKKQSSSIHRRLSKATLGILSEQNEKGELREATTFRLGRQASANVTDFAKGRVVRAGRRRKGSLQESDSFNNLRRKRFVDHFQVKGIEAGRQIHIRLNSRTFDTYIQVLDRNTGELLFDNDDQSSGVTNSRLTFVAQSDVEYGIKVTSFAEKETGTYSLRVKTTQPATPGFFHGSGLLDASAAVAAAGNVDLFKNGPVLERSEDWNLNLVNASAAWDEGLRGQGVVVAVIDSGVSFTHDDLAQNIWQNPGEIPGNGIDDDRNGFVDDQRGWDFVKNSNKPGDPNGHGTFISGIIAGQHNGVGVSGIAPEATIMPVRVLDSNGSGRQRDVAKGIRYAVNNGADIINLSLGGPPGMELDRSLKKAIKFAYDQGVFVAIASGNDRQGYGSTQSGEPAFWASSRNYAISVGAVDELSNVSSFSNPRGNSSSTYVVAPGSQVYSILPWYPQRTFSWSGTSFATPHVAGVAALMLSANPDLSPLELMDIITASANPDDLSVA